MAVQTSLDDTGSDAMNGAVDFSCAYCILKTDSDFTGHGMVGIFSLSIPLVLSIGRLMYLVFHDRPRERSCLCCN